MNRGSARRCTRSESRFLGFNEAPIHESGKSATRRRLIGARKPASMRPRFMNRGSIFVPPFCSTSASTFNEAPIHESGKYAS